VSLQQAVLEEQHHQQAQEDLQAAHYLTVLTVLATSMAVVAVAALITFEVDKVAHPAVAVEQDLPVLVHQILEDSTQTPFTDLEEMAAADRLELHMP
jgi:hypothetical protein